MKKTLQTPYMSPSEVLLYMAQHGAVDLDGETIDLDACRTLYQSLCDEGDSWLAAAVHGARTGLIEYGWTCIGRRRYDKNKK